MTSQKIIQITNTNQLISKFRAPRAGGKENPHQPCKSGETGAGAPHVWQIAPAPGGCKTRRGLTPVTRIAIPRRESHAPPPQPLNKLPWQHPILPLHWVSECSLLPQPPVWHAPPAGAPPRRRIHGLCPLAGAPPQAGTLRMRWHRTWAARSNRFVQLMYNQDLSNVSRPMRCYIFYWLDVGWTN